uniref:Uncharacterized protein n=1 Tax=Octopus bimaculoides TaxID=37653 RepID=A0A0L8I3A8_OCTBM
MFIYANMKVIFDIQTYELELFAPLPTQSIRFMISTCGKLLRQPRLFLLHANSDSCAHTHTHTEKKHTLEHSQLTCLSFYCHSCNAVSQDDCTCHF